MYAGYPNRIRSEQGLVFKSENGKMYQGRLVSRFSYLVSALTTHCVSVKQFYELFGRIINKIRNELSIH